jgi:hypothetical protein
MLIFGACDGAHRNHIECLTFLMQEDHGLMGLEVTFESPVGGRTSMLLSSNTPFVPLSTRPPPETLQEYKMSFDVFCEREGGSFGCAARSLCSVFEAEIQIHQNFSH